MLKSVLLAGFFWASANFMPAPPAVTPTAVAASALATLPAPAAAPSKPVRMASLSELPKARLAWEIPLPAAPITDSPTDSNALQTEEEEFVARINAERTERGLNTLSVDPLLVQTARAHSREMCRLNYFNHHSPTPGLSTPMDRYLQGVKDTGGETPDYLLVGENIYYCSVFNDVYNVDYGHQALMNSPGHRANILDGRFTKIGLGVYRNPKGEFWVTEMFTRNSE